MHAINYACSMKLMNLHFYSPYFMVFPKKYFFQNVSSESIAIYGRVYKSDFKTFYLAAAKPFNEISV